MINFYAIFTEDMDLTINKIFQALTEPFTAVGVLGTVSQAVVLGSQEVEAVKAVGGFAPNGWSVFLPAIATTVLVIARAFVLVRTHLIEQKRASDKHRQEMRRYEDRINEA